MAAHMQNPGMAGASRDHFGGRSQVPTTTLDGTAQAIACHFPHHRQAALALLNDRPGLSHKEAGFLGHVAVAPGLSDKQRDWLEKLLDRNGLPPLTKGGEHG